MRASILYPATLALVAGAAWGHIDELKFGGVLMAGQNTTGTAGQSYNPGQTVQMTWKINIRHSVFTIYYSSNGGMNWTAIASNLPNTTTSYSWTVPSTATTNAKIRVFQLESGHPLQNSTDEWNLVTPAFTVRGPSPVLGGRNDGISLSAAPGVLTLKLDRPGRGLRAEISALNGAVLRTANLGPSGEIRISTRGLHQGKALLRLTEGERPLMNRLVLLRP